MWIIILLAPSLAPPAPPGATVVLRERVYAPFSAVGETTDFSAARRQSISSVFSSYTGIATGDILTTVADSVSGVDVTVDHAVPSGTTGASIASALNNGIMRSKDILQAALQNTGGTIVDTVGSVSIVEAYEFVYPPPGPGPPLSETIIIVIAVGGVLAFVALIGVARYCDAGKLRETTRLVLGITRTALGGGPPPADPDDGGSEKKGPNINIVVKKGAASRDADTTPPPPSSPATEANASGGIRAAIASRGRELLQQMLNDDDEEVKKSARMGART